MKFDYPSGVVHKEHSNHMTLRPNYNNSEPTPILYKPSWSIV
jgi:hypothetical protein